MTSRERVELALSFQEPDRVPRYLGFSDGFVQRWKESAAPQTPENPLEYFGSDLMTVSANETPWPSGAGVVRQDAAETVSRDGWGSLILEKADAKFNHIIEPAISHRLDPDSLTFENPLSERRYARASETVRAYKDEKYVICKTGGPYIRASFMRGREAFLLDMAEDPSWVKALVERLTDHLIAVGVESIHRFGLQETGIIVHDDVCSMRGPIMGPDAYEKLFFPSLAKMIKAYKDAGAARYIQHCDGDVRLLLDMWTAAGVDVINPCEPRAGFDPLEIKKRFGRRLAMIGGLDNTRVLPRGRPEEVERHLRQLLEAARGGGLVVCAGISEDVSVKTMELVRKLLNEKGRYPISFE